MLLSAFACTTSVKPGLSDTSVVRLQPWAESINDVVIANDAEDFFSVKGGSMIDWPTLSPKYREEITVAVKTFIIRSGGEVSVQNAPDLRITLVDYQLSWDFSRGIDSTATVRLRSDLMRTNGETITATGEGIIEKRTSGVILASSAEPQINAAFTLALGRLLSAPGLSSVPRTSPEEKKGSSGTCFAVHPDGWLVTAAHVVSQATRVEIQIGGLTVPAVVAARDEDHDLALLRVGVPTPNYISLGQFSDLKIGLPIYTLGFPLRGVLTDEIRFTNGTLSSMSGLRKSDGVLQVSVPVQPGNSGGPLLTEQGLLVGVIVSRAADLEVLKQSGSLPENIAFATSCNYVHKMLEAASVRPLPPEEIPVEIASKAVHPIIAK
jgi:S1-C subfamily serine protease